MREVKPQLDELGVSVIGVAAREDYQAQRLLDDGMPFDLLIDPSHSVRAAIGADQRFGWHRLLHPKGAVKYAKAIARVRWNGITPAEANQRPAVAIADADQAVVWRHIGAQLGDYPSVPDVLDQLRSRSTPR